MIAAVLALGAICICLVVVLYRLQIEHATERRLLNACIQRPETAVAAVHNDLPEEDERLPYVPWDDDEAFNDSLRGT